MNTQRTIIIDIDTEKQIRMWCDTDEIEWCRAVGYLASWGRQYPNVKIIADGEVHMVALYYDEDGNCDNALIAAWKGDHYDFVSPV